jgi:hypothetical protein
VVLIGETVTILRNTATGRDAYGNDKYTHTSVDVSGCGVWPSDAAGGNETTQGRDTVISGLTVLFPPGTAVAATDRVVARGATYEVVGEPGTYVNGFTATQAGTQVTLRRVQG